MCQKKGRRVRKIVVPTDSVPKFELEDTAADIRKREEREERERKEAQKQRGWGRSGGRRKARVEETHSQKKGVVEKRPRTERRDTETDFLPSH